jgi:hypothetical protein
VHISENQHIAIAVILFMGLLIFVNLGSGELQSNGEGELALSAVLKEIPGVNTLSLKSTKFFFDLFSVKPFFLRLTTAITAIFSTVLCWLLARRLAKSDISVLIVFLVSGSFVWNYFSRLALPEMQIMFFILLSLWLIIKSLEIKSLIAKILMSILLAAAIVAAFSSSTIPALLPLIFAAIAISFAASWSDKLILLISTSIGLVVSYLLGFLNFGNFEITFFAQSIKNHTNLPAPLLVAFPFIFLLLKDSFPGSIKSSKKILLVIILLWSIVGLAAIPFIIEKSNLSFYLLPPLALLTILIFENFRKDKYSLFVSWLFAGLMVLAAYWTISWELRYDFFSLFEHGTYGWNMIVFALIFKLFLLSGLFFFLKSKESLIRSMLKFSVMIVCAAMVIHIVYFNFTMAPGNNRGALECRYALEELEHDSFIYLYHETKESDEYNSQLDWYLGGWMSSQIDDHAYLPYSMPGDGVNLPKLRKLDKLPTMLIIYFRPDDRSIENGLIDDLAKTRPAIIRTRSYIVFGMVRQGRKGIKEI